MSCCGSKRALFAVRNVGAVLSDLRPTPRGARTHVPVSPVIFEYVGKTGLTVRGSATHRIYRFASSGAHLAIDPRDAGAMRGIPNLREHRTPSAPAVRRPNSLRPET